MNHGSRPHLLGLLAGLFLAAGLVLSASWEGIHDTFSFEKTVTAVVSASFSLR